jgi:hypothetical protein
MAPERGGVAMEGFLVLVQVGTGPMKGHSWLEFEVSRVFIAQQNGPCFLVKAENLICCAINQVNFYSRSLQVVSK